MYQGISKQEDDFSQWYNDLVVKADLAENSPVRGCMIIKPYGYALWENMQRVLNQMFKDTGHVNAYFPLFIPKLFFSREAEHVKGFAKECAVITHYRLKTSDDNSYLIVDTEAKLEEELILRPTSETIIWSTYKNWIQSYRDLPLLLNQWANVVRWEMRTRLFLRTTEFLWQEGHTAHATRDEAIEEAEKILNVYADFAENYMALPVLLGIKTEKEKFAGAETTYCVQALMQDGKSLQLGTSHFLGQNFAKAFDVKFQNKEGKTEYVWATSWGVSTRLIGALIMAHSDNKGLILPPKLAPLHVVIVPIYNTPEQLSQISDYALKLKKELENSNISVKYDDRDTLRPGFKFSEYELKGIPVRINIGMKELSDDTLEIARRDTLEKAIYQQAGIIENIKKLLSDIQNNLFQKALKFVEENTSITDNYDEFKTILEQKGGYILAHWDGTTEIEQKIQDETKATIQCILLNRKKQDAKSSKIYQLADDRGKCIYSGKTSLQRVVFAKAY